MTGRTTAILLLALALSFVGACDSLLDVDLPSSLTDDVLEAPSGARTQVNSIIANFECGYSAFAYYSMGQEDVLESIAGRGSGSAVYGSVPQTGPCDTESEDDSYYDQFSIARRLAFDTYDRLSEWAVEDVPQKEQLQAETALYATAALDWMGEYFCEMTMDNSGVMTPAQTLAVAEEWADKALNHISTTGDFAVPHGATTSAQAMAYGLRARIRWAMGNTSGALADAEQVPQGYVAWVTRDQGFTRRNKPYNSARVNGWGGMVGVNDWWNPADRTNPATGEPWPNPIPFTGYIFLGIMEDDGRAVTADGYPIRWAEEFRLVGDDPTPLDNGAVPDTRVPHEKKAIKGPEPKEVPAKYNSEEDDVPLVNWEEMWLIRAEIEGGQTAIDLVNDIRDAHDLPLVTYADPGDPEEIRYMIIEERRRSLFEEGRYWATKILNTDLLWFPRSKGFTPSQGYAYEGGVRQVLPTDEYELNPNIGLGDRATGCDPAQAPVEDGNWF